MSTRTELAAEAFIYGFPFRITDCPPSLSHTPASQTALRLAGNFLIFLMAVAAVVLIIGRARRNLHHVHE